MTRGTPSNSFDPRAREGATYGPHASSAAALVSIHAPVKARLARKHLDLIN